MKAVQIKSYGDPLEVLEVVDVPEPQAPGTNEALLGIELATLNKHDLLFIGNALGGGPALPDHRGQRRVRACPRPSRLGKALFMLALRLVEHPPLRCGRACRGSDW